MSDERVSGLESAMSEPLSLESFSHVRLMGGTDWAAKFQRPERPIAQWVEPQYKDIFCVSSNYTPVHIRVYDDGSVEEIGHFTSLSQMRDAVIYFMKETYSPGSNAGIDYSLPQWLVPRYHVLPDPAKTYLDSEIAKEQDPDRFLRELMQQRATTRGN